MHCSAKKTGFTLIELLISITIIGLLSIMIFTDFSREKSRSSVKTAVNQLQTDARTQQTKAQGGVTIGVATQNGYGLYLRSGALSGTPCNGTLQGSFLFADAKNAGKGAYDNTDQGIVCHYLPSEVTVIRMTGAGGNLTTAQVLFASPNGTASFVPDTIGSTLTVVYKNTKINVCYAVTIQAGVGTVSQRLLNASCT